MKLAVVVVAAGQGERLGQGRPKALVELAGRPLLHHALAGLAAAGMPAPIVVHAAGQASAFRAAVADLDVAALVPGGDSRTASVAAGLAAVPGDVEAVLVHDAARALTPPEVIRAVSAALDGDVIAAAPGLPVSDTLKRVADGRVVATVDRADLVAVQTPQGFTRAALSAAHAAGTEATDDLTLLEVAIAEGDVTGRILVVPGSVRAMKVTYGYDLAVAEALLQAGTTTTTGRDG